MIVPNWAGCMVDSRAGVGRISRNGRPISEWRDFLLHLANEGAHVTDGDVDVLAVGAEHDNEDEAQRFAERYHHAIVFERACLTVESSPQDSLERRGHGAKLRELRRASGLTMSDVARRCGVSVFEVLDYERGARPRWLAAALALLGDDTMQRNEAASREVLEAMHPDMVRAVCV